MEEKSLMKAIILFVVYAFINFYFIFLAINSRLFYAEFLKLDNLLDNIEHSKIVIIVTIMATIITLLSVLIQYALSKFLLVIFVTNVKGQLAYALLPKGFILIINIVFILFFQLYSVYLFAITGFIGAVIILLFFQYKTKNWRAALIFSFPFLIDCLFALGKGIL